MGCDTKANLIGAVCESEIASFLAKQFRCRASYINVTSHTYGKKSEISDVRASYDNTDDWITVSGPIILEFLGNKHGFEHDETRSLFYIRNNVNFYENLEYYEEKGLGDMVRSRTTYISARSEKKNINLIKAIVEEFGGWFTENDCEDEYVRIYGRREECRTPVKERRADIVANVQTITGDFTSPISAIYAIRTNVETGIVSDIFDDNVSNCGSARSLLENFCKWINDMTGEITRIEDVYIWNVGNLYADIVLRRSCENIGISYPILSTNSRDVNTLFDIVIAKKGYPTEEEYVCDMEKSIDENVDDDYAHKLANIVYRSYSLALGRK